MASADDLGDALLACSSVPVVLGSAAIGLVLGLVLGLNLGLGRLCRKAGTGRLCTLIHHIKISLSVRFHFFGAQLHI